MAPDWQRSSSELQAQPSSPAGTALAQTADSGVERDQLPAQTLELTELGDLLLGFAPGCRVGNTLRMCFPVHFIGEPQIWAMSRVIGLGTAAARLPASSDDGAYGSCPEIAKPGNLVAQFRPAEFKIVQLRHATERTWYVQRCLL